MAYVGACTGGGDGATAGASSVTLGFPGGAQAGHACVIVVEMGFATPTATTPSGWTKLSGPDDNTTGQRCYMFGKLLTSGDISAGSVTVTWSASARVLGAGCVLSGVDQSTPFGNMTLATNASKTSLTVNGVATSTANSDVLIFYGHSAAETPSMPGTQDVVVKTNLSTGNNYTLAESHISATTVASYGSGTITTASVGVNLAYVIAVNQAGVGGGSGGAIGTPTAFSAVGLSGSSLTAGLPAGINTGDLGVMLMATNSSTTLTPPSGWTIIEGPKVNKASNECCWLLTKTMSSSESSTTVTGTIGAVGRWGVVGMIVPSADTTLDVYLNFLDSTTGGVPTVNTFSVPAITPTTDNDLLAILAFNRYVAGTAGITAPGGWSELVDVATNTNPDFSVWCATNQLTGGSSVAQGPETMTGDDSFYPNGWALAVRPVSANTSVVWHFYDGSAWRPATESLS